jgi:hypothetical protein
VIRPERSTVVIIVLVVLIVAVLAGTFAWHRYWQSKHDCTAFSPTTGESFGPSFDCP